MLLALIPAGIGDLSLDTLLEIIGIGVPRYSARGLTQSLDPINASAQLRRTLNGVLHDYSDSNFQKYKSTITCSDQQPPAVDGIWPGKEVTVKCIAELCEATTSPDSLERTPVAGSVRYEEDFTFYRPQLTMKVVNFTTEKDEYGAIVSWAMELEEV